MRSSYRSSFRDASDGRWSLVLLAKDEVRDAVAELTRARGEPAPSLPARRAQTALAPPRDPPAPRVGPPTRSVAACTGLPPGTRGGERIWLPSEPCTELRLGCASHRGPASAWAEKGNEDFAFALHRRDRSGAVWALIGVCDGVSHSAWSERGAQHAARAFIDSATAALEDDADLAGTLQTIPGKRAFAARFHAHVQRLLSEDSAALEARRDVPPDWRSDVYLRSFFGDARAEARRQDWLQSTLLAVALGPSGGFALLLGDGLLRIERCRHGKPQRRVFPLQTRDDAPALRVSRTMTRDEVFQGLRGIVGDDATQIDVLVATDGAAKSPAHGLEVERFDDEEDCRAFLERLAARPAGEVEADNMSLAFVRRNVS